MRMEFLRLNPSAFFKPFCCLMLISFIAYGQTDPGVRPTAGGPGSSGGTGDPLPGLTPQQLALFNTTKGIFIEVDSVSGTLPGEGGKGLGPSFNLNSCAGCHVAPAIGGSSPKTNPQIAVATLDNARNVIPSFISINGPIREARLIHNPDGSPDGGVHDLFVIAGRVDTPAGCQITQTDFSPQVANNNVSFRIPTPTFGTGLMEMITDAAILANKNSNLPLKAQFHIAGRENRTGNDGTITRFGWKAQNKSLTIFAGEAYNVEQGVTNELFPNARENGVNCDVLGHSEDHTDFATGISGDVEQFAMFMRLLAPALPVPSFGNVPPDSIQRGSALFAQVGCSLCHTPALKTGISYIEALSNKTANLYSDILVHHMGQGLADNVSQGGAGGDEFRSAPLWGVGQRVFFLHDGRANNLKDAIQAHSSPASAQFGSSEASTSIDTYNALPPASKQDVLNFLRSL